MSQPQVSIGLAPLGSMCDQAADWLLASGIQEPSGGVARYYRLDLESNACVSTEITGYAVSTWTYLHSRTDRPEYLDAAIRAADFLVDTAWDAGSSAFPVECSEDRREPFAYFFDTGIIVRGLLALSHATGRERYLQAAIDAADAMQRDFASGQEFIPILSLPEKKALPCTPQWSRSAGCYQLKSALAWHELGEATGEAKYFRWFDSAIRSALDQHRRFLPAETPEKTMDRLHAYSYFLEGLLVASEREAASAALAEGIERVSRYRQEIGPVFERSDVCAQLLRVRLLADAVGAVPLDRRKAEREAAAILPFQLRSEDPRIDGGFAFGRKGEQALPYVNPVSTAFCLQALAMWQDHCSGADLDPGCLI